MSILEFPNHLIVFPKWTAKVMQEVPNLCIMGKRAADGYLVQLLMQRTTGDLPDFAVCNLSSEKRVWAEYVVDEPTLIQVNKDKIMYDPHFLESCDTSVGLRVATGFLNVYSSVDFRLESMISQSGSQVKTI